MKNRYTPKPLQLSRAKSLEDRLRPLAKIAKAQLALLDTALPKAEALIIIIFIQTSLYSSLQQVTSLTMRASALPSPSMGKVDAEAELANKMERCLQQILDGKAVFGAVSLASLVWFDGD